jgi:hypothetical protein
MPPAAFAAPAPMPGAAGGASAARGGRAGPGARVRAAPRGAAPPARSAGRGAGAPGSRSASSSKARSCAMATRRPRLRRRRKSMMRRCRAASGLPAAVRVGLGAARAWHAFGARSCGAPWPVSERSAGRAGAHVQKRTGARRHWAIEIATACGTRLCARSDAGQTPRRLPAGCGAGYHPQPSRVRPGRGARPPGCARPAPRWSGSSPGWPPGAPARLAWRAARRARGRTRARRRRRRGRRRESRRHTAAARPRPRRSRCAAARGPAAPSPSHTGARPASTAPLQGFPLGFFPVRGGGRRLAGPPVHDKGTERKISECARPSHTQACWVRATHSMTHWDTSFICSPLVYMSSMLHRKPVTAFLP